MKNQNSNSLCILPWSHLYEDFLGETKLCCRSKKTARSHHVIREEMLRGERPSECQTCYSEEECGILSERVRVNGRHPAILEKILNSKSAESLPVNSIDVRYSAECNFACAMCDEHSSSKWDQFKNRKGDLKVITSDKLQMINDHLENRTNFLYLAGGEPLLQQPVWEMLFSIRRKSEITLEFGSNWFTTETSYFDLNRLNEFKKVSIDLSIDGTYEVGEYIRSGLNFKRWVENVDRLAQTGVNLNFFVTFSILNLVELPKLLKFLSSRYGTFSSARLSPLTNPKSLSVENLSKDQRDKFISLYKSETIHFLDENLASYLLALKEARLLLQNEMSGESLDDFWSYLKEIDRLRHTDYQKSLCDLVTALSL